MGKVLNCVHCRKELTHLGLENKWTKDFKVDEDGKRLVEPDTSEWDFEGTEFFCPHCGVALPGYEDYEIIIQLEEDW